MPTVTATAATARSIPLLRAVALAGMPLDTCQNWRHRHGWELGHKGDDGRRVMLSALDVLKLAVAADLGVRGPFVPLVSIAVAETVAAHALAQLGGTRPLDLVDLFPIGREADAWRVRVVWRDGEPRAMRLTNPAPAPAQGDTTISLVVDIAAIVRRLAAADLARSLAEDAEDDEA